MIQVSSILKDLEYNDLKPTFKVLLNTDSSKEIRILMRKGQVMKEHSTPYPIVVEVFFGRVEFRVQEEIHLLMQGDMITLSGGIPHDLTAQEDAVIRLSLSKMDSEDRLKEVIG